MPTANTVAVRVAIDNAKEAIAALRGIQDGGEAAFQSLIGGANKASAALERIPGAANQNIQGFRRFGEVARQAGFQVGDFAVQVQSGTNLIVAGTQQLSQFAGAFGIYGAALGGVLSIGGAIVTYFQRQNEETAKAPEILGDFISALASAEGQATKYAEALATASGETRILVGEVAKLEQLRISKAAEVPAAGLSEALRTRLEETISAQVGTGELGFGADALIEAQKRSREAIALAKEVTQEIEAAVKAGDQTLLSKIINDNKLATDATVELITQLQELAAQSKATTATVQSIKAPLFLHEEALVDPKAAAKASTEQAEENKKNEEAIGLLKAKAEATQAVAKAAGESALAQRVANIEAGKQEELAKNALKYSGDQLKRANEHTEAIAKGAKAEATAADARIKGEAAASAAAQQSEKDARDKERELERLDKEAERNKDVAASIDEKLAASQRELEAADQSVEAQKFANIEHEKQVALLQVEKDIKNDLKLLDEARAKIEETAANKRKTVVVEADAAARDKAAKERERLDKQAADKLADVYAQPFKDLATNLSSTLSEGIQDALSGEFDFQTFADSFTEIFADTLAASITSVLAPSLNAAADEFGKAIASAFAEEAAGKALAGGVGGTAGASGPHPREFAPPGGAPAQGGLTYGGAALGGAAAGGIVGGLYGQYGPGMKPGNQAALGGAIGGAIGGAAGLYFGPGGAVVGAALGGAAGSAIGGLFGGQNNLGNDRSAQAYRAGRGITYGDTSFSAENRAITEGILSEIQRLEEAFVDLGGTVGDVKLRIEAGSKTGITVDGKKYATAEDALVASIEKLIGETTGLTPSMQTVLANTKATSAADIGVDLGIAAQFDEMTFSGTELERQLVALDAQMAAFGKKAAELGLDINAVAAAHENERQALIAADQANKNQILAQIDALAPSGNALELQLRQLNDQVQALAAAATDAGLPLDDLAAAHQRAAAQLVAANDNLTTSLLNQVSALDPAANQLELALSNLNQQVQALAAQLVAAGLPVEALAATHQRAAAALVAANAQLQQSLALQVQILGAGPNDQLGIALAQLDQQVQGLAAQIIATGGSLDELAAAHQRAGAGIIEDFRQREALAASQAAADRQRAREQAAAAAAQARAEAEARAEATRNYATQLTLLEADPLNAIVVNIRERIRQLIEEGKKLGLTAQTEAQIKAAGARLEKQAIADYQKSIDDRVRSFQQQSELLEADELGSALIQIRERFREILEVGKELNILPETKREIEAAQARAEQAAREQTARNRSAFRVQLEGFGAANDNDLGRQLRQLDIEFAELGERAKQLLIPLSEVTAAHARAAEELREADRELRRQFLREVSLVDATDLERELARIDDQFRALIKTSIELGYATNVLRQEQAEAEAEAIEATRKRLRETDRSLGGAQRDVFGQIDQYLDPIKQLLGPTGVGQGVYSGAATAGGTLEEFRKTLALARGGDVGALQGIGGIGQSAIQAARVFGASGAQAAAAFKEVTEGFREVAGKLEEKRTALVQQGLTYQKVMIDEQIRQRVEVVEELKLLRAELARSLALANQRKSA